MRQALLAALPPGVQLLDVQSADVPADFPFTFTGGVVNGGGLMTSTGRRASFQISVQPWTLGAPPCTADLTLRVTAPDGTITDVREALATGHTMLAESFHPDGTLVEVNLGIGTPTVPADQPLPLTARQLATLGAVPELAMSQH